MERSASSSICGAGRARRYPPAHPQAPSSSSSPHPPQGDRRAGGAPALRWRPGARSPPPPIPSPPGPRWPPWRAPRALPPPPPPPSLPPTRPRLSRAAAHAPPAPLTRGAGRAGRTLIGPRGSSVAADWLLPLPVRGRAGTLAPGRLPLITGRCRRRASGGRGAGP